MSSSSANRQELNSVLKDDINAELALWKQLAMPSPPEKRHINDHPGQSHSNDDSSTSSSSQISSPHFQVPHTAPPPLPPETYSYLIHALLSLQGSASHTYSQHYPPMHPYPIHSSPLPNYHYPWPPSTAPPPISAASIAGLSSLYTTNPIPLPPSAGSSQPIPSSAASSTAAPTTHDPEGTEDTIIAEDKRRRNTAASARFRVKKKLKTLNLERTVSDLTGRAEELERETTDLRRENAWLKEIVLLKGRNITALNLGSQAPGNRHDEEAKNNRTHAESESELTVRCEEKGKDKGN